MENENDKIMTFVKEMFSCARGLAKKNTLNDTEYFLAKTVFAERLLALATYEFSDEERESYYLKFMGRVEMSVKILKKRDEIRKKLDDLKKAQEFIDTEKTDFLKTE
jgi:hypothetical protein